MWPVAGFVAPMFSGGQVATWCGRAVLGSGTGRGEVRCRAVLPSHHARRGGSGDYDRMRPTAPPPGPRAAAQEMATLDRIATADLAKRLLTATRDGVAIIGPAGQLLFWNAAAQAITGWSSSQAAAYVISAIPDGLSEIREGKWADTRRFEFSSGADRHTALIFSDATTQIELGEAKRKLRDVGLIDPVTGLPGRALTLEHLARAESLARRDGRAVGVLAITLAASDDTNGSATPGPDLVRQVARRLATATRLSDFVAQTGPLDFVLILTAMTGAESAMVVTARLLLTLSAPFVIDGRERSLPSAIGVSHGPEEGVDAATLLDRAQSAMKEARADGAGYAIWRTPRPPGRL